MNPRESTRKAKPKSRAALVRMAVIGPAKTRRLKCSLQVQRVSRGLRSGL